RILLSRFSCFFGGIVSTFVYYPPKKTRKSAKIIPKIDEPLVTKEVYWLKIAFTLFLGTAYALFQEIHTDDETWFFQVISRFLAGESLYKDIFLGVGPLSVYCTAFVCLLFGQELFIARLVLVSYFTIGVFLMLQILTELKLDRYRTFLFVLTCFILAHPQSNWGFSAYNPLSKVLFLAVFWMTLKWSASLEKTWLLKASCFSALCFTAKQNVGAIAALCVSLEIFAKRRGHWLLCFQELCLHAAIFSATAAIIFFPVIISGGIAPFFDYGVINKFRYLALRDNNYFLDFKDFSLYSLLIYATPFALIFGWLFFSFQKRERNQYSTRSLFIFLCGSALALFPRPDNMQKIAFVPFALLGTLYFYSALGSLIPFWIKKSAKYVLTFFFSCYILNSLEGPCHRWIQGHCVSSKIPKFRWIVMDRACHRHWRRMQKEFSFPHGPLFFLSTHAGFYYLLFDLQNPTPFDIPFHPALGSKGEQELIRAIQEGMCLARDHLCWSNWPTLHPLNHPADLETFIQSNMKPLPPQAGFETIFETYTR
ncbi:MAG TPA: hypothetical protein VLE95_04625, partial [Chlamydiales bacterium]|nr:hypothetical protein [Chlamydiales bacterium]